MIHIDNGPVKQRKTDKVTQEPPKHALVAHAMPNVPGFIIKLQLLHLLLDHCGISNTAEAMALCNRTIANGKTVVRLGTRDLVETLLSEVNKCGIMDNNNDIRFTTEEA